jgi:hypothetical protein
MGDGAFARVVAPPSNFPEGVAPRWREWGRARAAAAFQVDADRLDELRIAGIVEELRSPHGPDVPEHVMAELERIDPKRWYAVELVVTGYQQNEEEEATKGEGSKRRIRFVGIGRRLWYKIANVAEVSQVEDATVKDVSGILSPDQLARARSLKPERQAWAIWANPRMMVTLSDGAAFKGRGDYQKWRKERDARKGGRGRKRRGPRTYEEGTRIARADAAAAARHVASEERIRELRRLGRKVEADRLQRRVNSQRDAQRARGKTKGRGIFARVEPKKMPSKRRGKGRRRK